MSMPTFVRLSAARRLLAMCAAFAFCAAASAAELTLYDQPGFAGTQLTLRAWTPNIANTGFNDRASSAVVVSGRWEVCTDAEFQGYCVTLSPGDYPRLDKRFSDHISSARAVDESGPRTGNYSGYGRGSIQFFAERGFRGAALQLDRDAVNFENRNFNDRASSVVVNQGSWELCSDAAFRGTCRVFAPGRYADLGYGMEGQISSARLMRAPNEAPIVIAGSFGGPYDPGQGGVSRVILFNDDGYRGRSMAVSSTMVDLEPTGFNDQTASVVVEGGSWLMCSDAYFRGTCRVLGPGRYAGLDGGLHRSISSLRPVAGAPAPLARPAATPADFEFYSERDFGGDRLAARGDVGNLSEREYNDRAQSLVVYTGQWELCTDAQYGGRCAVFGPGRYANLYGMNRQVSSVRRLQ